MEKFRLVCGIDVSKKELAVAILLEGDLVAHKTYSNNAKGLKALYQFLLSFESDPNKILVCLEHTGVYSEKLILAYQHTGLFIWVVNGLIVKYFQVSFERLKTDKADAKKIARFAFLMQAQAQAYQPLGALEAQIRDLFRLRKQLTKLRQQTLNYAATNMDKAIPCMITKTVFAQVKAYFNGLIKEVENELKALCKQDKKIKRVFQILCSIPGIGQVNAWQLIFTTDNFKRFESYKKFAAYAGIAPFEQQSGSSLKRKPRVSKKAATQIKTNLTMGALRQTRKKMVFHQYYQYMLEHEKKHHLWILNSIRNIMVKLAFDLVKKDQLFELQKFLINKKSWAKCLTLS
ncbi:MAG: IS110 family transposase [Cyanobacteria bacterium J06600_6]